ncbi:MAG: 16S rRNA (cytosine(1402)-N(4))-methyltransferase RsmH [Alphaproteobacteria bacterium]|nr:16S rRNA (cytosine(1402)-N(4))-methyltransferase RsmH [Alphaproteobacteria bacterium]
MSPAPAATHASVMADEVVAAMAPLADETYVDGTFGGGGYTQRFLDAAPCRVVAIDRDPEAVARGRALAARYPGRLEVIEGRFGDMGALLAARGFAKVNGIALDLGVSSFQIDEAKRGFSFGKDGPLDMRMSGEGPSAADLVNDTEEGALADVIYRYGEERYSRRIARAVVAARREKRIERTGELAELVAGAVPRGGDIHPATRTFQALRIAVNDELGEIDRGLAAAERLLEPEGRLVVVAFHSLEDRLVKQFLSARSRPAALPSRHVPPGASGGCAPTFRLIHRRALRPSEGEIAANPRARSARLRAAIRNAEPAPARRAA